MSQLNLSFDSSYFVKENEMWPCLSKNFESISKGTYVLAETADSNSRKNNFFLESVQFKLSSLVRNLGDRLKKDCKKPLLQKSLT